MIMSNYQVGFKDLKFLVDGFEGYGCTRKGAVEWCKQHKAEITPKFIKGVRDNPEGFFYYETHIRPDEEYSDSLDFSFLEKMYC